MLYLPCPKCRGELQVRVAKRGSKAGSEFYGCDNFPQCKFTAEKTNIIDLVKKEIFKKQIPTQDSKYWTKEHLSKLSILLLNSSPISNLKASDIITTHFLFLFLRPLIKV